MHIIVKTSIKYQLPNKNEMNAKYGNALYTIKAGSINDNDDDAHWIYVRDIQQNARILIQNEEENAMTAIHLHFILVGKERNNIFPIQNDAKRKCQAKTFKAYKTADLLRTFNKFEIQVLLHRMREMPLVYTVECILHDFWTRHRHDLKQQQHTQNRMNVVERTEGTHTLNLLLNKSNKVLS